MFGSSATCSKAHGHGVTKKMSRREIANSNERRRMQQINTGFDALKECVPSIPDNQSKASILARSVQYIKMLQQQVGMAQQQATQACQTTVAHAQTQTQTTPSPSPVPQNSAVDGIPPEPQHDLAKRADELERMYEMERQRNGQLAESIAVLSKQIQDLQEQCARYLPSPISLPTTPPRDCPLTVPLTSPYMPPSRHPINSPALSPWEPPISATAPSSLYTPLPPQADPQLSHVNNSARPDPNISYSMWHPQPQQRTSGDPAADALPAHARMSITSFVSSYSESGTPYLPPATHVDGQAFALHGTSTQQVGGSEGRHVWGWGMSEKVSQGAVGPAPRRASGANNLDTLVEAMQHVEHTSRLANQSYGDVEPKVR